MITNKGDWNMGGQRGVSWGNRIVGLVILGIMGAPIYGAFEPGAMYYNTANGNFGLGTDAPQTFLHLKTPNPILTLMSTSAGAVTDNNGTNNGWAGLSIMTPTTNAGTARLRWDLMYSARDRQLYLYDYTAARKTLVLGDNGVPEVNGGLKVSSGDLIVSGNVGIGTATPISKLTVNGDVYGKSISTPYSFEWTARSLTFLNGSQNQKMYINLGPIQYWGSLEVSIYDGWSHARTTGKMTKLYDVGINIGNPYASQSRLVESFGPVSTQWKLGEIEVGSDNSVRIPIYHLVPQQNAITVHIKGYFATITRGAEYNFTLTNPESSTHTLDIEHVSMALGSNQRIGIGTTTPTAKLHVNGNLYITGNITATDTFNYPRTALQYNSRNRKPSEQNPGTFSVGFGSFNNNNGTPYADTLTFNTWGDSTGGRVNMLMLNKSTIGMRIYSGAFGSTTPFSDYRDVVLANPSGNVGIGVVSPDSKLHVAGNIIMGEGLVSGAGIRFENRVVTVNPSTMGLIAWGESGFGAAGDLILAPRTSSNLFSLRFYTNGDDGIKERIRVAPNGNLGIGTISPEELLTIRKSVPATVSPNYFVGLNLRNLSDGGNRILFGNSITTTLAAIDGTVTSSGSGTDDGILVFNTSVNGVMTEKMRIANAGNVGIGTANPVEKLDVVGNVRATQFIGDGSRLTGIIGGAGSALVVSANGNVGIGTMTPTTKLDVSGNVILRGSVNLKGFLDVGYDGDSLGKLSFHHSHLVPGNQYFTGFVYSNSSGQFNFETAPANNTTIMMGTNPNYDRLTFSGVSWNSTTSTKEYIPRMIIRGATGFVGIGTTNPTEKLHVVGNVKVDGVIRASDILVSTNVWADKVFDPGYKLMSLTDVANYIHENRHLPDVPSEAEVLEKGINVAKMQTIHMQKIEELMLYLLQLNERIDQMQNELNELKSNQK